MRLVTEAGRKVLAEAKPLQPMTPEQRKKDMLAEVAGTVREGFVDWRRWGMGRFPRRAGRLLWFDFGLRCLRPGHLPDRASPTGFFLT